MRRLGTALILLVFGRCSLGQCTFRTDNVTVAVSVTEAAVAIVTFVNGGDTPIRLARTHGVSGQGLQLLFQSIDGRIIGYPATMAEATLPRPPRYFCLSPRTTYQWEIPLRSFAVEYGGKSSDIRHAFELPPGRYRVQAVYRDRCEQEPCGELVSAWSQFEIVATRAAS